MILLSGGTNHGPCVGKDIEKDMRSGKTDPKKEQSLQDLKDLVALRGTVEADQLTIGRPLDRDLRDL